MADIHSDTPLSAALNGMDSQPPGFSRKRCRVLLVDDDEDILAVFGDALERYGFEVRRARNGSEGVQAARDTTPDIVLMDLSMPVMDGFAAVQALREDCRTAAIPVLAVTGAEGIDDAECIYGGGFDDLVLKPVDPIHLVKIARKWSRASSGRAPASPRFSARTP